VHHADPALDVVQGVAGEGAPGRVRGQVADAGPGVDPDRPVAQRRDRALERLAEGLPGAGMDDEVGSERSAQAVVRRHHRGGQVVLAGPGQLGHAEDRREVLGLKRALRVVTEVQSGQQRPRWRAAHGLGGRRVPLARGADAVVRARVPVGARVRPRQRPAQLGQEGVLLTPAGAHDDDLRGDAVGSRIVQPLRGDVPGLEAQVGR